MNKIILLFIFLTVFANNTQSQEPQLSLHGNLKKIASNSLNESLTLSQTEHGKNITGIGMPRGLNKELIIIDGKAYTGGFSDLQYSASQGFPSDIDFFAYAQVEQWQDIAIPETVKSFKELEQFIENTLSARFGSALQNTVLQIKADVSAVKWFVVGGMGNLSPTPLSSFLRQKILGGFDNRSIHMAGIYTHDFSGRATSGSNTMHLHFITVDEQPLFVGHVDNDITLKPGAVLRLPIR